MSTKTFSKKGLIFDWDGTLFNSIETIIESVQIALKQLKLPEVDRLTIKNGIGLGEEEICHYLFGTESDVTPEMFWVTYRKAYNQISTQMYDHVLEALSILKQKGFQLAIATNKRSFVFEKEFRGQPIEQLISHYICADMSKSKPEPDMLMAMCKQMDLLPEEVWMVGDTVHDAHAAERAGCGMLGLLWGVGRSVDLDPVCDEVFDTLGDLATYALNQEVVSQEML